MKETNAAHEGWINDVALNVDIFMHGYCGYWARNMARDEEKGRLVLDVADLDRMPSAAEIEEAERKWLAGETLPAGWYVFDRALAEKALAEGLKKYGEDFPTDYDGPMADCAMQRALFGEERYG